MSETCKCGHDLFAHPFVTECATDDCGCLKWSPAPSPSAAHAGLLAKGCDECGPPGRTFGMDHILFLLEVVEDTGIGMCEVRHALEHFAAALRDMVREAGRFYHADGSFTEHDPATVIEMRKAAAVKMVAPCHNCGHSCEGLTLPASPSPGAVEAAYKEGHDSHCEGGCTEQQVHSAWLASDARSCAAGGMK